MEKRVLGKKKEPLPLKIILGNVIAISMISMNWKNTSGWMSLDTFYKWFKEEKVKIYSVKEGELKKHLLMHDGYLSHILLTIIELPPHTTHNLQ